jgi:predicted RNA binding protein YcfA (HicA-like mRNA interferase family)
MLRAYNEVSERVDIDRWLGRLHAASVKVGELIRLLLQDGWQLARTRGSHRQYRHPRKPGTVTVSGKASLDVPPGTSNAILKQAGLKKRRSDDGNGALHGGR